MYKKIIAGIMAFTMFCGAACVDNGIVSEIADIVSVSAEDLKLDNGLSYQLNEKGTEVIIRDCDNDVTEIEIPPEIDGLPVTTIDDQVFSGCQKLTSIVIPDSVKNINDGAFGNCTSLESVIISDSVVSIGDKAFYNTAIVNNQNTDLKYVDNWLVQCDNDEIKEAEIKEGTRGIANLVFYRCDSLTSTTFPESVEIIGLSTFGGCTSLSKITLSDSITYIGYRAFAECTSLKSVIIPDSVKSIGDEAFYNTAIVNNQDTDLKYVDNWLVQCDNSKIEKVEINENTRGIADVVFHNCEFLAKLTFSNYVNNIGKGAFYGCKSLTTVTIPTSVTNIGWAAFGNCELLKEVTIPDSVTDIGDKAFGYCYDELNNEIVKTEDFKIYGVKDSAAEKYANDNEFEFVEIESSFESPLKYEMNEDGTGIIITGCDENATEIEIPAEIDGLPVTNIGYRAFNGCTSLTKVTLPDSVTSIGWGAFSETPLLENQTTDVKYAGKWVVDCNEDATEVEIRPDTVGIADYAFGNCTSLNSVTIPDSVTSIGISAFYGCTSLTSVTIPDYVTSIGDDAFSGCTSLREINIDENNKNYSSIDGVVYNNDKTTLIICPVAKASITIPNSVTEIKYNAFNGCTSLTSVTIPNSVTSIDWYAFSGCTSLTSVTIPNSVVSIDEYAFNGCTSLTEVTIPDSVTFIGNEAFGGCTSLTDITIPDSVTSIGYRVFSDTPFLNNQATDIKYAGKWIIDCNEDVTAVEIKPDTVGIAFHAFTGCKSLTEITIPDSVKYINDYTFQDCTSLKRITIPDSVTDIGVSVFYGCTSLEEAIISNSVKNISGSMFNNCKVLTSVIIPDSVTEIESYAFLNCESLESITIPDSVENIQYQAFWGCKLLKEITIPASVTSIEDYALGYYYNENWDAVKTEGFTIKGVKGSAAEKYANDNEFEFVEIENPSAEKTGDIDGDGEITSNDALNILQLVVGMSDLTDEKKKLADLDGDGEITSADALCVLQMVVGLR